MIAVSNQCREACESNSVRYKEYIVINQQTIEIRGKLSANAFNDRNFIGTFNLKSLSFETENNIDFKNKEFEYYKQVNNENEIELERQSLLKLIEGKTTFRN